MFSIVLWAQADCGKFVAEMGIHRLEYGFDFDFDAGIWFSAQ